MSTEQQRSCPNCGRDIYEKATRCQFCWAKVEPIIEQAQTLQSQNEVSGQVEPHSASIRPGTRYPASAALYQAMPVLVLVLRTFAVLQFLAALIVAVVLWPDAAPLGYERAPLALLPALAFLIIGIVSSVLLWAIGDAVLYLRHIRDSFQR